MKIFTINLRNVRKNTRNVVFDFEINNMPRSLFGGSTFFCARNGLSFASESFFDISHLEDSNLFFPGNNNYGNNIYNDFYFKDLEIFLDDFKKLESALLEFRIETLKALDGFQLEFIFDETINFKIAKTKGNRTGTYGLKLDVLAIKGPVIYKHDEVRVKMAATLDILDRTIQLGIGSVRKHYPTKEERDARYNYYKKHLDLINKNSTSIKLRNEFFRRIYG